MHLLGVEGQQPWGNAVTLFYRSETAVGIAATEGGFLNAMGKLDAGIAQPSGTT